jgi:hypothetical protein
VPGIALGPVRVRSTPVVAAEIESRGGSLLLAVGDGSRTIKDEKLTVYFGQVLWEADVKASPGRVADEAKALINAAITLLRLQMIIGQQRGSRFPNFGEVEADPFVKPTESRYLTTNAVGFTTGGLELPRLYVVNDEIAAQLSQKKFLKLAKGIFEAAGKSVGERIMRGLNWMSRARQSTT